MITSKDMELHICKNNKKDDYKQNKGTLNATDKKRQS